MPQPSLYSLFLLLTLGLSTWTSAASAQQEAATSISQDEASKIVTFTTQEDHQHMLQQLGITKLRPGPSGNASAPNHANSDESLANPYPNLPDVMTLKSGAKVTTPDMWWKQRRPEIIEEFEREVLGRVPQHVPQVTWEVVGTEEKSLGETAVIQKQLNGKVDSSACPEIEVNISMVVVTPKEAAGKVPVLMMFGFTGFEPGAGQFRGGFGGRGVGGRGFGGPAAEPPKTQQLVERGWGYATISPASIQADNGAGLTRGIIGLTNQGQPRKPDDWGSLRAWAWGASRGLDYLETDKNVDASRVGIDGVSRYGKAALVTMAFDQRFAMVLVGSSGEGGASLYRRNFGEAVENLTGSGEYHWMAGNFLKYGTEESTFGAKNASDLPVDAHELIALCAPRPTFISYGIPERGDASWLDHQGSFMAAIAAQPVFRLLGARDLGRSDDYMTEKMPAVNVDMLDGELAWRQHDGGHTDLPNIKHFVKWADKLFAEKKADQAGLEAATDEAVALFSPELVKFRPIAANPLFQGRGKGNWDEHIRERGWILRDGNQWQMWYTGFEGGGGDDGPSLKLGYATSPDGLQWTRYPDNPLYDKSWVEDMMVVRHGDTYYMFAEGKHDIAQLLTSTDGIHWSLVGPLDIRLTDDRPISDGPRGTPTAYVENGTWYLFYERRDLGVWLATSNDTKVWRNVDDEPVLRLGPGRYDDRQIAMNQIVKHNGYYYAYFHGSGHDNPRLWSTNVAVSKDLFHWTKYRDNPLLPIEGNKSSGILVDDGKQFRLYTMHNQVDVYFPVSSDR